MPQEDPLQDPPSAMKAPINGMLAFRQLELAIPGMSRNDLEKLCLLYARDSLITQPGVRDWIVGEALGQTRASHFPSTPAPGAGGSSAHAAADDDGSAACTITSP